VGGGAWPFLVRGAICLVNSANERDSGKLNSLHGYVAPGGLLRGKIDSEVDGKRAITGL
jgi:hypothetical protein